MTIYDYRDKSEIDWDNLQQEDYIVVYVDFGGVRIGGMEGFWL